jgi:hypothetical protein
LKSLQRESDTRAPSSEDGQNVIGTDNTIVVDVSQALTLAWAPCGDHNQQIIDTDVIDVIKMVGDPIIPGNSTPSNPKADSKTVWSAI